MLEASGWFDRPNPNPKRRRPMADLLVELAERNGDPVWPAHPYPRAVNHLHLARCTVCGMATIIRRDGTLRVHVDPRRRAQLGWQHGECPGSGEAARS